MRGWVGRISSITLAALALASLAACGGGPGGPSGGGLLSGATSWFGGSTKIAIAPIIGTPPEIAAQMTDALVVAGKDRKLTLLPSGGKATYTLRGYLVASSEKQGAKISYIWDVTDAQGQRVARVSGDEIIAKRAGSDPWSAVDAAAIRSIAGKTTSQIAASLPRGRSSTPVVADAAPSSSGSSSTSAISPPATSTATTTATAATAAGPSRTPAPKAAGVLVQPVSGAPGDGQRSLTIALKKRLYA